MKYKPSDNLTPEEVQKGLKLVVKDGLAAEAMATFTGGTFLVAIAIHLGASNLQIGLLAGLPTLTNVFQLFAIWLVQRYKSRKAIAVICNTIARFPLIVIGLLPFAFSAGTSLQVLIFLLFIHYFFGSIAGASWNSWMKDLVPENILGTYHSHRNRLIQILNVTLSLLIAVSIDFVKVHYPAQEMIAYSAMFLFGALCGMIGNYLLAKTPEPRSTLTNENLFKLFSRPIKNKNFRNLLVFNSFWAFALNLATPFFSVYMMKSIGLPLSYVIGFGILAQLSGIFAIKIWGKYSDQYSNKTIISIAAPLYILCIVAMTFTASAHLWVTISLLSVINIFTGLASSGVNLAINNMTIKLAPKDEAIVYMSASNMVIAFFTAAAPLAGGLLADFFAHHSLVWDMAWQGPKGVSQIHLLNLQHWNFLFVIGAVLAVLSLRLLRTVKENGEVRRGLVVNTMRANFRKNISQKVNSPVFKVIIYRPVLLPTFIKHRIRKRKEQRSLNYTNYFKVEQAA